MFAWITRTPVAFAGLAKPPAAALPGEPRLTEVPTRAAHARMLAQAAARRRRALSLEDGDYWRALAPQAVAQARTLRAALPRLP